MHTTRFVLVLMSAILALYGGTAAAQPSLERGPRPDISERGSIHYSFETLMLDAPGGERRYRVQIARPRLAPPAAGYPAIFLLDGNAAIEALDDELLGELATAGPPVIVAIGYDTPLRFDVVARAHDYTPPLPGGGPQTDPLDPTRTNGGAKRFLDFIQTRVKPEVATRVPLDAKRQGVWGHSYGGLFVLHTLLTQPAAFTHYAAASPALWWRDGHLLTLEEAFGRNFTGNHTRLLVLRGDAEDRRARPPSSAARLAERERATAALPTDAVPALVSRLGKVPGLDAQYRELPGLEHGPMLPASLGHTLRWMAETAR